MPNHLGSYECKLCLTLHNNEGNYLAHTQGKRHENNLAKHAAREGKDAPAQPQPNKRKVNPHKAAVKIGRPGYHVTKQYDQESRQRSLLFQVQFLSTFYDVQKVAFMCHFRSSTQRLKMDPNLAINLCLLMNRWFNHGTNNISIFSLLLSPMNHCFQGSKHRD